MAKVKITGHASGTGTLTITAPNTSTDRTITLPDGTGTLALTTGDDDKLPLAGGTLTGNLAFSSDGEVSSTSGYMKVAAEDSLYLHYDTNGAGEQLEIRQGSAGTARLNINSDGYVTQNNLPFMFWDGGDNYNTRTLAAGDVFFNTAQASQAAIDHSGNGTLTGQGSNGITYASGTGRFTVPVTGRYYISAHFKYAATTVQEVTIALYTNSNHAICYSTERATNHQHVRIEGCANLAANDYIDFRNVTGSRDFYMADTHTGGQIFLIG
jgi:hypothetical protein